MRIKQLKIAGFRGFNVERTIDFHERLTLISAPNSHGKTSVTEGLEFLIYGETSKVARAHSKEEYRDSYRNRHYSPGQPAVVEAVFANSEVTTVFRAELDAAGNLRRFVDGTLVQEWPFTKTLAGSAPPFVLQHALKNLLLVAPTDRFQGFAKLLGLDDVDSIQQGIVSLCTKPDANIPDEARRALSDIQTLEARLAGFPELQDIQKDWKRGPSGIDPAYKRVQTRASKLLGKQYELGELLPPLIGARDEVASQIYSGDVALKTLLPADKLQLNALKDTLIKSVGPSFIENYSRLGVHDALDRLKKEAHLLALGEELMLEAPHECPLCGQNVNEQLKEHIATRHETLKSHLAADKDKPDPRSQIQGALSSLQVSVNKHSQAIEDRSKDLLAATGFSNQERVRQLFGKGNEASWKIVESASTSVAPLLKASLNAEAAVAQAIVSCKEALQTRKESVNQAEALALATQEYLSAADIHTKKLDELEPMLLGPARLLRQAIDATAGTTELSALIELLEKRPTITRVLQVRELLEGLKELKKHVDQTVGEVMEAAIGSTLTGSVMDWYKKIRTQGDPDIHFSGFSMERTKAGDFKSRRVKVSAQSYGVELASAVSSLSESKLNALGLCMSIATALRSPGPWSFLILDDPIQSWDEEHEVQFIEIIRALAEEQGKQIILLSHREQWVNQVSLGCRSINGIRYRITGYTQDGPHVAVVAWAPVDQRLREVMSIVEDPLATPIRLQQAEEEIRIAACQLASEIAKTKLGRDRSPHNLNKNDVRTILNEAGCTAQLVDKVVATFGTTDDSHHAPKEYQPNTQRIRQYHGTLCELKQSLGV